MTLRYFNFIPTYNNPRTVCDVIQRCLLESSNPLLIIDDGSNQTVKKLLKKMLVNCTQLLEQKRINLIRFPKNRGKGAALQRAIFWGVQNNFTHMITIDADGQFNPEEIKTLQLESSLNPWDFILGERIFPESTPQSSIFGRKFSNMWVRIETGLVLSDTQTGFRCYPLFWVQNIKSFRKRFVFELELIVRGIWMGAGARTVPVQVQYPEDRVSHFNKFKDNLSLTLLHTQLVFIRCLKLLLRLKKIPAWNGKQSKGAAIGTQIFISFIKFLGLRSAYFLLIFVAAFYYVVAFRVRCSLGEYWRNVYPNMGGFLVQKNIYMTIYQFGQTLIYTYYIRSNPSVQKKLLDNFTNLEISESVLLSGHFGYWNVAAFLFKKFFKKEISTIEYIDEKQNFEKITYRVQKHRQIISTNKIENEIENAALLFYESQQRNEATAGLIDRPIGNRYELVRVFNKLMPIDVSFGQAAQIVKSEVLFFTLTKTNLTPKFQFNLLRPTVKLQRKKPESYFLWATEFAKFYESQILKSPHSWANFYVPWKIPPSKAIPPELIQNRFKKPKDHIIQHNL